MKCLHKILTFVIITFVIIACDNEIENSLTIGILQIVEDPQLDLGRNSMVKLLADSGFVDNDNIKIKYRNAQGELSNISMILQSFKSDKVDLILTIGTPCAIAAAQFITEIPVVYTIAFSPEQLGVKSLGSNIYGSHDPYDVKDFVQLISDIAPHLKKAGIPYNPTEANALYSTEKIKSSFLSSGYEVFPVTVNTSNDLQQSALSLIQKGIDFFVIPADNVVLASLPILVQIAEKYKKPIFLTESSQTEKGASIGFGIDNAVWGRESGKIAVDILRKRTPKSKELKEKFLVINPSAAANQGLFIPEHIKTKANLLVGTE